MTPTDTAVQLLRDAADIISGDRAKDHGDMVCLHNMIAEMWSSYLSSLQGDEVMIGPSDVASMMELLKICRRTTGTPRRDHFLDSAGYAAIAYAVSDTFED